VSEPPRRRVRARGRAVPAFVPSPSSSKTRPSASTTAHPSTETREANRRPRVGFLSFFRSRRYAVFDFEWDTKDGCKKSKIVFVTWVPDTAKIRQKMLYASSKDKFKRELDGIQVEIQGTDFSEVEEKVFLDKCAGI